MITLTEIIVTLLVLIGGLLLSVHFERKARREAEEARKREIDRLLSFDEADIYD